MVDSWFYGISLFLFVKLYLNDISMNINPLMADTFDGEGGDNRIREFKIGKDLQNNLFQTLCFIDRDGEAQRVKEISPDYCM